jgi:hypothetical protein
MMDDKQYLRQLLAEMESADVLTIFFPLLRKALVVDTRRSSTHGPTAVVLPVVSSTSERVGLIQRERPELGPVQAILSIPWIKSVETFREGEVFERTIACLARAGVPEAEARAICLAAVRDLQAAEYAAKVALVRGENCDTVWPLL